MPLQQERTRPSSVTTLFTKVPLRPWVQASSTVGHTEPGARRAVGGPGHGPTGLAAATRSRGLSRSEGLGVRLRRRAWHQLKHHACLSHDALGATACARQPDRESGRFLKHPPEAFAGRVNVKEAGAERGPQAPAGPGLQTSAQSMAREGDAGVADAPRDATRQAALSPHARQLTPAAAPGWRVPPRPRLTDEGAQSWSHGQSQDGDRRGHSCDRPEAPVPGTGDQADERGLVLGSPGACRGAQPAALRRIGLNGS